MAMGLFLTTVLAGKADILRLKCEVGKAIITMIVWLGLAAVAQAAEKKIEVTFEYNAPAKEFRLYMDGQIVCLTPASSSTTKMICTDVKIVYGVHMFTMTAVTIENIESPHSPAYVWTYSPINGDPPIFLNLSITVDGKSVAIGPLGTGK